MAAPLLTPVPWTPPTLSGPPLRKQPRLRFRSDTNVNLHTFSRSCEEIERSLLFRDRLRESDADRVFYERTKRELAAREWRYVQNYADAKTAVIEEIIARARGAG